MTVSCGSNLVGIARSISSLAFFAAEGSALLVYFRSLIWIVLSCSLCSLLFVIFSKAFASLSNSLFSTADPELPDVCDVLDPDLVLDPRLSLDPLLYLCRLRRVSSHGDCGNTPPDVCLGGETPP